VHILSKTVIRIGSEEGEVTEVLFEQLLLTTFHLELSDEAGRKKLEQMICQAIMHAPLSEFNLRHCVKLLLKLKGDFSALVESLIPLFREIDRSILEVPQELIERVQIVGKLKILEVIHILVEYPEAVCWIDLDMQKPQCCLAI
jgi:hypothetical protein